MPLPCFRISIVIFFLLVPSGVFAHGGGLDANGGHTDHSTGSYHFHSGQSSNHGSLGMWNAQHRARDAAVAASRRRELSMLAASRREAKEAREAALKKSKDEGVSKEIKPEPEYLFHHTTHTPFEVVSFKEVDEDWKIMLTKGFEVRVHKKDVCRIEPVHDPNDFRMWHDAGGHTLVAKFVSFKEPNVTLESINGKRVTFDVHKLSHHDQLVLYYEILHPEKLDDYHQALAAEAENDSEP